MKIIKSVIAIVIVAVVLLFGFLFVKNNLSESKPEIISEANLTKIINVSELSTSETVYNGVAKVMNKDKPTKIDYYVSYEAKVQAGIDFEDVGVEVDDNKKVVIVTVPPIEIQDPNVDIKSLDYIFENKKADTSTVLEQAYKACIKDAEKECEAEQAIYELAEENAHDVIEGLIKPFVQAFDEEYELEIQQEEAK